MSIIILLIFIYIYKQEHPFIDYQPIFDGFCSVISLTLYCVTISRKTLLHLLSTSSSHKSFRLLMLEEDILGHEKSTMIELFECLSVIEHLTIWSEIICGLFQTWFHGSFQSTSNTFVSNKCLFMTATD
ncbi:hypothetical protein Hanom_Chr08g00709821 [Helianthus anomalus]